MKRIGIEISATIRYDFVTIYDLRFRYESLQFQIRYTCLSNLMSVNINADTAVSSTLISLSLSEQKVQT